MEEIAYAKLNLALHVRAREPDGYHRIETLFAFCADGDRLRVEEAEEGTITLRTTGPFAKGLSAGEDNLVLRAARALQERMGATRGAALTLEKNLPVASGIGGGSADAAATLRLLARWWGQRDSDTSHAPAKAEARNSSSAGHSISPGTPAPQVGEHPTSSPVPNTQSPHVTPPSNSAPYKGCPNKEPYKGFERFRAFAGAGAGAGVTMGTETVGRGRFGFKAQPSPDEILFDIARTLGADVPACLFSQTARGEGRGDRLRPVDLDLAGTPVLLVNPGVGVSTAAVFKAWDGVDKGPMPNDPRVGRNDLEPPARALAPEIDAVLAFLAAQPGATLTRMSGSGATCFALFDNEGSRDAALAAIAHAAWWGMATQLI